MAFKKVGSVDFSEGEMKFFICYCEHCRRKVLWKREEMGEILKRLGTDISEIEKQNAPYYKLLNFIEKVRGMRIKIVFNGETNNEEEGMEVSPVKRLWWETGWAYDRRNGKK